MQGAREKDITAREKDITAREKDITAREKDITAREKDIRTRARKKAMKMHYHLYILPRCMYHSRKWVIMKWVMEGA